MYLALEGREFGQGLHGVQVCRVWGLHVFCFSILGFSGLRNEGLGCGGFGVLRGLLSRRILMVGEGFRVWGVGFRVMCLLFLFVVFSLVFFRVSHGSTDFLQGFVRAVQGCLVRFGLIR